MRRIALPLLAALALELAPACARADEVPREAVERYQAGRKHYLAGRYREAVVELERALALDPNSPDLVYNVARVYELLGEFGRATEFYTRYRAMLTPEQKEERARIDATLLRLSGAQAQHPEPPPQEPSEAAPPKRERGVADAWFWAVAGTGAASLATGLTTGTLALVEERNAERFVVGQDGSRAEQEALLRRAERLALASDVTLGAGLALGAASLLLYLLRERPVDAPSSPGVSFGLDLSSQNVGLWLGVRSSP